MRKFKGFVKNHKYVGICASAVAFILFSCLFVSYARYALTIFSSRFLMTQNFYFSSNKLKEETAEYAIENWAGTGDYEINIMMQNTANLLVKTSKDIKYNVKCESLATDTVAAKDVTCSIDGYSSVERVISKNSTNDSFVITLTYRGSRELQKNDSIKVKVTANSTDPYEKELSGTFEVFVGYYGVTYTIEDEPNQVYLNALISNAKNFYVAKEQFTDHGETFSKNQKIFVTDYEKLSEENQKKCTSAIIKLSWDASKLRIDTTNPAYINRDKSYDTYDFLQLIDGKRFIKDVIFEIDAESSMAVKFYKYDIYTDNSYPDKQTTPIVSYEDRVVVK